MSYSRCSFKSVLDMVLAYAGQASTQVDTVQTQQIGGFINQRLRDWAWIGYWWPEVCPTELRRYRNLYSSGTTYAAPTATTASEVYFPPTQQYYQALRATTGNAPAALSGGTYVVNAAYWAVASGPYTGPDWTDATAYALGTIVRNPDDGRYYQCYIAHTSSGTLDLAKFGLLTIFDPYIARTQSWEVNPIGEYLSLSLDNPQLERRPRRIQFKTDALGAHILTSPYSRYGRGIGCDYLVPHQAYLKFRLPAPDFAGPVYSAIAIYTANIDTVYFSGTTRDLEGDYWTCLTTTTAGESPETTPAKWQRLQFPLWLRTAVARRAFADWLRYGSQREAAAAEDVAADDALFQAQLLEGAQQGQYLTWRKAI